ncbi:calmodulin-like [Ptychodera flava]|uniref:calmodulin-like n=1 Tax=Ptychodera flava TaxID=63121 RepID=UPI00396A703F
MTDKTSPAYIRSIFDRYDLDGNGSITISELKQGLRRGGIDYTDDEIYQFMRQVDLDGNGEIDFNEFSIFWIGKHGEEQERQQQQQQAKQKKDTFPTVNELRERFSELDADGNGYITIDEVKMGLLKKKGHYTDEEVYKIMRLADEDGDGRISFSEYVIAMTKHHYENM